MTKLSMRKISLLGLVLMGASAVTAAIIPSKAVKADHPTDRAGNHIASTVGGIQNGESCVTQFGDVASCTRTDTDFTTTSAAGMDTSVNFNTNTLNDTSGDGINTSHDGDA